MNGKVSVVLPVYNAEVFLAFTIESVLAQSYKNLELLIIDDVSTDDSFKIAKSYESKDKRVRAIKNSINFGGPAGPRNIGIDLARGEWIAFIDSDDLWHPEKLYWQLRILSITGKTFCCTSISNFKEERNVRYSTINNPRYLELRHSKLIFKDFIPTSSVVVSRTLINKVKFKEDKFLISVEDYECWLQCHNRIDFSIKLLEPLTFYRLSDGQLSKDKINRIKKFHYMFKNYSVNNGKVLGSNLAVFYTFTHYLIAAYEKIFKNGF